MSSSISILVANHQLNKIGGSETFTFAFIAAFKRKGFDVEYFTFAKGLISDKIEHDLGVEFMTKKRYDLILASHTTCIKKLFHRGFIIQICHGIFPALEQPSAYADFHISISSEVKNHLKSLNVDSIIINNGVDCERFFPKFPVKEELGSILSLCQSSEANNKIREICTKNNWEFFSINKFKQQIWDVENYINKADLVIGLGRSAYEAMACGRPVLIYDHRPYTNSYSDGYLTNVQESLKFNCSGRRFKYFLEKDDLEAEILKYRCRDGEEMRSFALENLNMDKKCLQYVDIFKKKLESVQMQTLRNIKRKKFVELKLKEVLRRVRKAF
ncbi:glycosyltransferase [Christiangramia sp. ASW11-125]|uniref:glycosyltransferase n=1 Tax=Christiangramia sp. ASW11-125 TaxID=3400701 RepID=UPI003AAC71FB